jgi:hypothetical protein
MYESVDSYALFSQKFAGLDDDGQDRLVKAALRLFEAQKYLKREASPQTTDMVTESKPGEGLNR